jgi:tetratricopeptide (TPR) repeat protein
VRNNLALFSCAALRAAAIAALAATLVSCASTSSLRVARNAEASQNYDIAVAEYTKLLRENPDNRDARMGLERAKLRSSQDHFTKARRLTATGQLEEALVEYQLADALATARQGGHSRRRQDAARIADCAEPQRAAARRRPAR